MKVIIYRQSIPNKYDQLPQNTYCIVTTNHEHQGVWEQVNPDPENPVWIKQEELTPESLDDLEEA